MDTQVLVGQLKASKEYLDRSTSCLLEEHSNFTPVEGTFTVAQQIAHVAQTVDWFREGVFGDKGFDMDFEAHGAEVGKVTSLAAAREWLNDAYAKLSDTVASKTMEEMLETLPDGPIMGGAPRTAAVSGTIEHTAHHRGALSVYSRLCGLTPAMPYM